MPLKFVGCLLCLLLLAEGPWGHAAPAIPSGPGQESVEDGVRMIRDIPYAGNALKSNQLDLYLPLKSSHPLPLIVLIHGGGWEAGDKKDYGLTCATFVQRGYASATINYRLSGEALWPAQMIDCKAAVRWLRAHAAAYGIDPNRIIIGGGSAGGHLAAFMAVTNGIQKYDQGANLQTSSQVNAALWFAGVSNLVTRVEMPGYESEAAPNSGESKMLGGPVLENRRKAIDASPITHVSKNSAPMIIFHGDKDELVPVAQAVDMYDALMNAGVPTELHLQPGGGHGFPYTPQVFAQIDAFLAKTLGITGLHPLIAQDFLKPGVYTIVPQSTSALVLDAAPGVSVIIATPNGTPSQKWQMSTEKDDFYSLHPLSDPALSLTVQDGQDKEGAPVTVAPDQGLPAQRWKIVRSSFGVGLRPQCAPERGLDNLTGRVDPGSLINIWTYNPDDGNLCWHFQTVP